MVDLILTLSVTYYQTDARQQGIASYTKKFVGTRLTRSLCSQSQMYNLQCEVCISFLAFIIADSFKKLFGQTESGFSITHPISCSRNGTLVNKLTMRHKPQRFKNICYSVVPFQI